MAPEKVVLAVLICGGISIKNSSCLPLADYKDDFIKAIENDSIESGKKLNVRQIKCD